MDQRPGQGEVANGGFHYDGRGAHAGRLNMHGNAIHTDKLAWHGIVTLWFGHVCTPYLSEYVMRVFCVKQSHFRPFAWLTKCERLFNNPALSDGGLMLNWGSV
jgi:hypothetical protein